MCIGIFLVGFLLDVYSATVLLAIFYIWGGPYLSFGKILRDYFCTELFNSGIIITISMIATFPFLCFLPSLPAH